MDYRLHEYASGLRLVWVPSASAIAHSCVYIGSGTRDEPDGLDGLAHFVEHLLFKRTKKRSTGQILNRLEAVGADLNAYTTKEYTCIHASFLREHLTRTIELFADIIINSTYPEEEIEKEREVILDEIASYADQPEEAIQDDFEQLLFSNHALGRNILGTAETLQRIGRPQILEYTKTHFAAPNIIVAVTGNFNFKNVVNLVGRWFEGLPGNAPERQRVTPVKVLSGPQTLQKPINQSHMLLGTMAYGITHERRMPMLLLNNYLGGAGMSAVLNLELREKHGIAYTVETSYGTFSDTGIFTIYFGTEPAKVNKAMGIVERELRKLRSQPLTAFALSKAKQRFIGLIALGEENRLGTLIAITKSLADLGRIEQLEEIFAQVNAVTAENVLEVATQTLDTQGYLQLHFMPGGQ